MTPDIAQPQRLPVQRRQESTQEIPARQQLDRQADPYPVCLAMPPPLEACLCRHQAQKQSMRQPAFRCRETTLVAQHHQQEFSVT